MPKASKDGVKLFYQKAGSGETPLLLIHGAICDHTFMQPQFDYFQKDRQVVSLDLRGHGQSDKPVQEYSIAGFARDAAWLCGELGMEKVIVVGHSLGGSVALKMAVEFPELVSAVAALDSTVIFPTDAREKSLPSLVRELQGQNYLKVFIRHCETAFEPSDDPKLRASLIDKRCKTPQHVMVSLFEEFMAWDGAEAAAAVKAPFLYMAASKFRTDINLLKQLCPHLVTAQVVDSGHFLQLMVPEQVNPILERFFKMAGV